MSVQAMAWVFEYSRRSGGQLLVLLAVANHARADGTGAWPTVATLAREINMSERGVQYALRQLEDAGSLLVEQGVGPHGTNLYTIVMEGENIAPRKSRPGVQDEDWGGANDDVEGRSGLHPNQDLTVLEPSKPKVKGADAPPKSPNEMQAYLLSRLHEIGGWDALTFGALVKLNGEYTRPVVLMALQRAREERQAPNGSAYGLIAEMCRDIAAKGAGA